MAADGARRLRQVSKVRPWLVALLLASAVAGASGRLGLGHTQIPDCFATQHSEGHLKRCLAAYIEAFMPSWDRTNVGTLRLSLLDSSVDLALKARGTYSWAADVPWAEWRNWVLPYASVNEARNSWRALFTERLSAFTGSGTFWRSRTIAEAVGKLNGAMWEMLAPGKKIVFKAEQTPMIYDPMSTLAYGYASCTGISIVLVDALRCVGIPARLVGTPAWNGKEQNGNHNWVEVWLGKDAGWAFMEGAPAGGGSFADPCSKWFCKADRMKDTEVYASQWDTVTNDTFYPMSWDLENTEVPGVNRTAYYREVCARCK